MSIAVFIMYLGLFAIPWTLTGLIHPPAAGMRAVSRWKILGYGTLALLTLLAVAKALSAPPPAEPATMGNAETLLNVLWVLSLIIWPLAAVVMQVKGLAKTTKSRPSVTPEPAVEPRPAAKPNPDDTPWNGGKPELLSSKQRKNLRLEEREPSEVARQKADRPAPQAVAIPAVENRFAHLHPESVELRSVAFLYENAQGEISNRVVDVDQVGTSHFAGFCHEECEERTFRFDRIIGLATFTNTGEEILPKRLRDQLRGFGEMELRRRNSAAAKTTPDILFTGFKKDRRAELENIAIAAGMMVRKNVTTHLDILCVGANAGPTKIAAARERGALVLDEQQLLKMLETGEVPA